MQYLRQCLRCFAACAAEVVAGRYLLQQGSDVSLLDYLQVFVRRIALQPDDRLRRVEDSNAFRFAERNNLFAVEHFPPDLCTWYLVTWSLQKVPLSFKMRFVAKENQSDDPPHVVLRVGVEEVHAPPFFGWRETTQHQYLRVSRQKRLQRMPLYVRMVIHIKSLQRYNKYPNLARVFVHKFAYM